MLGCKHSTIIIPRTGSKEGALWGYLSREPQQTQPQQCPASHSGYGISNTCWNLKYLWASQKAKVASEVTIMTRGAAWSTG